jgi:hypothetical protein
MMSGSTRERKILEIRLKMEFELSGLRQNEFCRKHDLALSTLQRQLKKRRLDRGEAKSNRLVAVELAGKSRDGHGPRASVQNPATSGDFFPSSVVDVAPNFQP